MAIGDHRSLLAATAAIALGGCTLITDSFLTNGFSGDPYPIHVETASGAIVVGVREFAHPDRVAVLDLLSPFTLTDPGSTIAPSLSFVDLTLLGKPSASTPSSAPIELATAVPRAEFLEAQVISVHPCAACDPTDPNPCDPEQCIVGTPQAPRLFRGIIGADALAGDAVRLRLGDDQMFILADVGGDDRGRSLSCDAVFDSPYRGGGTLVIAGTELPFGNRRITLQACLGQDPDPGAAHRSSPTGPYPPGTAIRQAGADALFVVSTSIGISILGQAAYERYRLAAGDPDILPFEQLTAASVYLPSGLVRNGRKARVKRFALVAAPTSNALAPCRQVYAHRFLTAWSCGDAAAPADCPCKATTTTCAVPAMVAFEPDLDVLVVPDTDPTLQALRTELRPDQPEVDGLLGTNALRTAEIDVDYPHDRLLARCASAGCTARPQLAVPEDRPQLEGCLDGQPTGPILPE